MSKKPTAVKAMKPRTDAEILRAIAKEVCEGSDVGALERVASHLDSDAKQDEKYQALQDIGKSAAESIAEMVAALECDYDRLEELRVDRDNASHYECGTCGHVHRTGYNGDCRNDAERFLTADVEDNGGTIFSAEEMEELAELESAAGDCESREDAEQRIHEDPLSVQIRNGWHDPSAESEPEEFEILLSTGGPATRIIGELDEHCEPTRARLQAQDWFTVWTDYTGDAVSQDDLLTYCLCFYFGE